MKRVCFILILLLTLSSYTALAAGNPADGQYTIEVTLSGGSGRADVQSPAALAVADGKAEATIVWSSPHYEYMLVAGVRYDPVNTDGNSTFVIPVSLDKEMSVSAQTVAMSTPRQIDYTLRFDSTTIKPLAGRSAALRWAVPAAVVLGAAAIFLLVRSSRRKSKGNEA